MERRPLGRSGIETSLLGLGTVKFGRTRGLKYPEPFSLPSDAEARRLLDTARDLGVNFVDTAPAYGASEERLGELLAEQRERVGDRHQGGGGVRPAWARTSTSPRSTSP